MRLGVIDIGSNTVHLLVVDAHRGARPLPAFSHKIELRLSEHLDESEAVTEDGIERLIAFAQDARHLADEQGVEEVMAFATSAVREARNGDAVLARIAQTAGVDVDVLSGTDEARLTFLAARRWCGWSAGTLLVLDIGGGSLELAHGLDEEPDAAVSVPLGAGRVSRHLLPGDPPSPETIRSARRQIRARLAADMRPLLRVGRPDRVLGSSKTFRSLARIGGAAPSGDGPYVARSLSRAAVTEIVARLAPMTAAERSQLHGVSQARSTQVLGGALVAEAAFDLLRVDELEICPWALREGVILRRLERMG